MNKLLSIILLNLLFSCSNIKENDINEISPEISIKENKEEENFSINHINTSDYNLMQIENKHKFENFKVTIYEGVLAEPNFNGNSYANDIEYVDFIKEGCRNNKINFCGKYTIIEKGCGAECVHIFLVNRINGQIFTDITPNDGRYGYEYRIDSKLLIANSSLFVDDNFENYYGYWCKPEFYLWENDLFKKME